MNKGQDYRWGLISEWLSAWALRLKGYTILAQRYRTSMGEIDLIAKRGNALRFVEVKARPDLLQGMESISANQRRRIEKSATIFIGQAGLEAAEIAFDAMVVCPYRWPKHVQHAWRYGE
ncbi:MAG: YraN family protein [Alphaproteobacteria bacterium]